MQVKAVGGTLGEAQKRTGNESGVDLSFARYQLCVEGKIVDLSAHITCVLDRYC